MSLQYVVTDLPNVWPGKKTGYPKGSPFKTQWTKTLELLGREIRYLGGRKVEIALDLPRGLMDLRQDGMLKADARPRHPVIVSFIANDGQRHRYPCDRFSWWQDNLYAIAKALEALRLVERYGVSADLVRAGFKAIPANTSTALSTDAAALVIARRYNGNGADATAEANARILLSNRDTALRMVRGAMAKAHPDRGGSASDFQLVNEAKRVLEAHFGGAL
jgi:hypothetical protein